MLTRKQLLVLFLVCATAFGAYFAHPHAIGYDSYYYLQPEALENEVIGAKIVFQALNGNVLAAKALLFACLFASSIAVALLGGVFSKRGWLAGIFVFLSPIFLLEFLKIESEAIAYPILFLSLYFLFKGGVKNKLAACFLIIFASLFWAGAPIYLVAASPYFIPALIPIAAILFAAPEKTINALGSFLPNQAVQEAAYIGSGITFHWALLLGFIYIIPRLIPLLLVFGAIGFLNAKFAIHLAPLLAVCLVKGFERLPRLESIAIGLLAGVLLLSPFAILTIYEPTQPQIEGVQEAVQLAGEGTVYNDWTCGHMVEYFGGRAYAKAGGVWEEIDCEGCVRLKC